jgi:hypothetical protein
LRIGSFGSEGSSGHWIVRWPIRNESDRTIRLVSAEQPHSQFRTPKMKLDQEIAPGREATVSLPVRFTKLPGVTVENPFLIVVALDAGHWRYLARVRVTAGPRGEPTAAMEVVVTSQRIASP